MAIRFSLGLYDQVQGLPEILHGQRCGGEQEAMESGDMVPLRSGFVAGVGGATVGVLRWW